MEFSRHPYRSYHYFSFVTNKCYIPIAIVKSCAIIWVFVNSLFNCVNKLFGPFYACFLNFHIDVCAYRSLYPALRGGVVVVMVGFYLDSQILGSGKLTSLNFQFSFFSLFPFRNSKSQILTLFHCSSIFLILSSMLLSCFWN